MPVIYWIFGPNGVGKTTNAQYLNNGVEHFNLDKIIMDLVEADQPGLIKSLRKNAADHSMQDQFLTYFSNNTEVGSVRRFNECNVKIKAGEDFSLESNFLPNRKLDILREAFKHNYSLSVIFIGEKKIEVIKERVLLRTQITGQFVGEEEIVRRYTEGLKELNDLLSIPAILEYKNHISEIRIFTMPDEVNGLDLILHLSENHFIGGSQELIKSWSELIPNLKHWLK